jgi:hypothetical protein
VAVGLPLNWEQFRVGLDGPMDRDFTRSVMREYPNQPAASVWEAIIAPDIALLERILEDVARLGVHTRIAATLEDLRVLFGKYRVVTIIAHWRPGLIWSDQVRAPQRLLALLNGADDSPLKQVREAFRRDPSGLDSNSTSDDGLVERFRKAANTVLSTADLGPSDCPRDWHSSPRMHYRTYANRSVLDALLHCSLLPGNRMELADGMRSIHDLLGVIPRDFSGLVDLTVCNSAMMCESLKPGRGISCIANEEQVGLRFRLELYRAVIEVLAAAPYEYSEAATDVRIAIVEEARRRNEKKGQGVWGWRSWV